MVKAMWLACRATSSEGRQIKAYSIGLTILGKLRGPTKRKKKNYSWLSKTKRLTERLPPILVDNINNFLITQLVSWAVLKLHNHLKL